MSRKRVYIDPENVGDDAWEVMTRLFRTAYAAETGDDVQHGLGFTDYKLSALPIKEAAK